MADPARMRRIVLILLAFPAALLGCGTTAGDSAATTKQAQPPVIVVQAPTEGTAAKSGKAGEGSNYAGLAWQAVNQDNANANSDPNAEPYDVVALLREFDPQLTDPPSDQLGDGGHDDIVSALAVMDDVYLFGRLSTRNPMQGDNMREVRFWIEQQPNMVTVEVKAGSRERPCELSDLKKPDEQAVVTNCFWAGNALDFRIPLKDIPSTIDTTKPYWVSGFQTCCSDAERNKPYDEIEGAQEVWRVPGEATEVETK
jgi:hypothetical protein